eukprot:8445912-Pyramimonas_sp.AAC.1
MPPSANVKLGDVVYFYREGKRKNRRKRGPSLIFKALHGPAVVIGVEPAAIYVSYEGLSTKCDPAAVRRASPDEALGISAREQLDIIEKALLDMKADGELNMEGANKAHADEGDVVPADGGEAPEAEARPSQADED